MKVECPHCAQPIEADDQLAGMNTQCPTCQKEFSIPKLIVMPFLPNPGVRPVSLPSASAQAVGKNPNLFRIVQIIIICATVLIGLWIWKGQSRITVATPEGRTIEVNISAIQSVLAQDHEIGVAMKTARGQINPKTDEDLDQIAAITRDVSTKGMKIDTSACPRDFAEAYNRHLSAWSDEADIIASHPHVPAGDEAVIEGFFRGLAGDVTGGAIELQDQFNAWIGRVRIADEEVNRTWHEVEALAVRYGAK